MRDEEKIMNSAVHFFKDIFKQPASNNLADQLRIIKIFPKFFSDKDGTEVGKEISLMKSKVLY